MRKTLSIPRVVGSMPNAKPAFLTDPPRYVTRRDWRAVASAAVWALAAVVAAGVGFTLACVVLL
jgi:hypothetical protein